MKNSNCLLIYISFIFYPFYYAVADTAWVSDPDIPFFQLKAHITALGKTHRTYAQNHLEYLKKRTETFQLKEKIKKAQAAYLSGDSSKNLFLNITDTAYLGDWNEEQRRIILYAFLRLSQLENSVNGKKAFLISAGRFITENLSPDYPEYDLFPPPLIEELNKLRNRQNSFLMDWKKLFPHYEILLVNGKRMQSQSRLNEGKYRVTVLSSSHAPWIQVINLSSLLSGNTKKKELITRGHCDSLELKPQWRQKNIKLLRRKNCPKPYAFNSSLSFSGKKEKIKNSMKNNLLNKKAVKTDFKEESFINGNLAHSSIIKSEELERKRSGFFNKKTLPKWIAIGGTLLAIGIFISLSESKKAPPERKVFH